MSGPKGQRIIAMDRELLYLNAEGQITDKAPNGALAFQLIGGPLTVRSLAEAFTGVRPKPPVKDADDTIIETYLKHANITGQYEREARNVWALYKTLTDSKLLKDADRDDGRKLVVHFEDEGLKSATIAKKVGWSTAACNLAIKEGRLKFNPFSSIVPKRDDKQRRLPLTEADIKEVKRNLARLERVRSIASPAIGKHRNAAQRGIRD